MRIRGGVLLVAGALLVSGCAATAAGSTPSGAPDCSRVVQVGSADLDGKAAWLEATDATDAARSAYMNSNADYVHVTDAQAHADALYSKWETAGREWVAVKRTPGCESVVGVHDRVDTARELVTHKSAGAKEKLAAALAEWSSLAR